MRPLLTSCVVLVVVAIGGAASAEAVCGKRADLLTQLSGRWSEAPVAMGLKDDGSVLEIVAATDGATWTVLITYPSGASCVVATGERWETAPPRVALGPNA
jgi:hypothetical protein